MRGRGEGYGVYIAGGTFVNIQNNNIREILLISKSRDGENKNLIMVIYLKAPFEKDFLKGVVFIFGPTAQNIKDSLEGDTDAAQVC